MERLSFFSSPFQEITQNDFKKRRHANPFWKLAEQNVVTTLTVGNYDTGGCTVRVREPVARW